VVSDANELGREDNTNVERGRDIDRVVFFSDAVFAIAMTILALSLGIPARTRDARVAHELREAVPSIVTYVLSFVVIGLNWIAHHRMFRYIRRIDSASVRLNLGILLVVAFVPFPTAVLGDHGNTTAAVVFYAGTMTLLGILMAAFWLYASRGRRLLGPETPTALIEHTTWRAFTVPTVFLVSIPIAFIDPNAAEWTWLAIAIVPVLFRGRYGTTFE